MFQRGAWIFLALSLILVQGSAPRSTCTRALQCSGNGNCAPEASADLCLCDPFWEGNKCDIAIPRTTEEIDGGLGSGDVALIVILTLITVFGGTAGVVSWLIKTDNWEEY